MAIARAIGAWFIADWRNVPLVLLAAFTAVQVLVVGPAQRSAIALGEAELKAEQIAHDATKANVRAATAQAELVDRRNAERVLTQQQSITKEIVDDYEAQLADVRARAAALDLRLRARTGSGTGASGGAGTDLSGARGAASGADEATGEDRLPAGDLAGSPAWAMSLEDAVTATEQALQLEALIDWVEAQALVDVVGTDAAGEQPDAR